MTNPNIPPNVPHEVPILDEDYTDIVEWTEEEEEAFLDIINRNENPKDL